MKNISFDEYIEEESINAEKNIKKDLDEILDNMIITDEMQSVINLIAEDNFNMMFITGKAGTGKSIFLKYLKNRLLKKAVFLAPTGIASINISGQTIHSFFKFGHHFNSFKAQGISQDSEKFKKIKYLVIDEISMVRADIFDSINSFLQANRQNYGEFFGGVKVILFGDLFQLPPIVSNEDKSLFKKFDYKTPYFFSSNIFKKICKKTHFINFSHIFRQKDKTFIDVLENVRHSNLPKDIKKRLNNRVIKKYKDVPDGTMVLSTLNKVADKYNINFLNDIKRPSKKYIATIEGEFKISEYPTKEVLELKVGAQIMFVKNDPMKRYVNGTIGVVSYVSDSYIKVLINNVEHTIMPETWEKQVYVDKNTDDLETKSVGSFRQIPVKLGWAISIHKSQGLTFDNVLIDTANRVFAPGQIYVALSRCTSFEGIYLRYGIDEFDLIENKYISKFLNYVDVMKYERDGGSDEQNTNNSESN